jgi:hypothetical protein
MAEEEEFQNWWEAIPGWIWVLSGGIVALAVMSVTVRLVFAESDIRGIWTLAQMALGLIVLGVAHFAAYMHGVAKSDRIGPLDAIMRPLAIWQPTLLDLPNTTRTVCLAAWGLIAVPLAYVVIDGVDYAALLTPKKEVAEKPKKRSNPMGFIIKSATAIASAQNAMPQTAAPADSLEESLADFTGGMPLDVTGGSGGPEGLGDLAGSLTAFTGEGGIDPDAFIEQQKELLTQGGVNAESAGLGDLDLPGVAETAAAADAGMNGQSGVPGSADATPGSETQPGHGEGRPTALVATPAQTGAASSPPDTPSKSKLLLDCVVLGYTTNAGGDVRSLLLAAPVENRLRFVGKVGIEHVETDVLAKMTPLFAQLRAPRPVIPSPYGGYWLRPELFCEVEYSGWSNGRRLEGAFVQRMAVVEEDPVESAGPAVPQRPSR